MESTNLQSTEQNHPIKRTKLAENFFDHQHAIERELGGGGNFREVFQRTIGSIFEQAKKNGWSEDLFGKITPEEFKARTENFFQDFAEIEMEDTLYHDIPSALSYLVNNVGGIVPYTQGDPEYQPKKIDKSRVWEKLLEEKIKPGKEEPFWGEIISTKKETEIPRIINEFVSKSNSNVCVVIYDDSVGNFAKAEEYIRQYENKSGIPVKRLYVWAKTGRAAEEMTPEKEQKQKEGAPEYETAEKLSDLENIFKKKNINPSSALVLLDFDGALSDNRIMRVRQAHVAYTHALVLIKDLVQESIGWKEGKKISPKIKDEIREQIKDLYSKINNFWKLTKEQEEIKV